MLMICHFLLLFYDNLFYSKVCENMFFSVTKLGYLSKSIDNNYYNHKSHDKTKVASQKILRSMSSFYIILPIKKAIIHSFLSSIIFIYHYIKIYHKKLPTIDLDLISISITYFL